MSALFRQAILAGALLIFFGGGISAFAQLPQLDARKSGTPEKAAGPEKTVEQKREQAAEQLRVAQKDLDTAKSVVPAGNSPPADRVKEVELRDRVERVIAQQQDAQRRKTELEATQAALQEKLKALREAGAADQPERSFLHLDSLRDELDSGRRQEESVKAAAATAARALERAKTAQDEKERARVAAKDAVAANKDQAAGGGLAKTLAQAELESKLAAETVNLRRMELENENLAKTIHGLKVTHLKEQVEGLARVARFEKKDLQAQIEAIEEQSARLKLEMEAAEPNVKFLEDRWFDARRRLEAAAAKTPELSEEVEARRLAYQAEQQQIAALNSQIQRLTENRVAWTRRFAIATRAAEREEVAKWTAETQRTTVQLKSEARVQTQKSGDLRKTLATLKGKAEKTKAGQPGAAGWIDRQQELLRRLNETYQENLVSIESSLRLHEKLLVEMRGKQAPTIAETAATVWGWALAVVDYPLLTVDDRPITIRKIVIGFVLLILGIFLARRLANVFGRRLLRRFGVHENAAAAMQAVAYYLLLLFVTLAALRFANVPLTTFTILGGAIALGIGFGSQNIVNNFISGLILFAERPIRVGDLIQVEGLYAKVEKIGARSTRVKTGANLEILVPNSKFLENNVVNWTLSDTMVRSEVKVGVVYGSPTRKVKDLLIEAAGSHGKVLPDPVPFVWFTDFGDNSLGFQVNFWIEMTSLSLRLKIESDIRFKIDELFRAAGITIAFPQRDVHLDTARPLEIRVLEPQQPAPERDEPPDSAAA